MNNPSSLFETIHKKDSLGFGSGPESYQKVMNFLKLSKQDLSKMAGLSTKSIRMDDRIPVDVKERLDQIKNVCLLVAEHFNDVEKTALWFATPNPLLGNISPRDMLRFGRYKRLMQFIIDARRLSGEASGEEE